MAFVFEVDTPHLYLPHLIPRIQFIIASFRDTLPDTLCHLQTKQARASFTCSTLFFCCWKLLCLGGDTLMLKHHNQVHSYYYNYYYNYYSID